MEPSMPQKAKTLAVAAVKAGKVLAKGSLITVNQEVKASRLTVCEGCPEYNSTKHLCSKCGCNLKYKLKLATESCPLNKWSAIKEP